jgi:cyclic pyranopterin phosphate synthase
VSVLDRLNRPLGAVRISVTDRCNLRCAYCRSCENRHRLPPHAILSFEEIVEVAGIAASMGLKQIRLTGGEPLLRRDVADLVRRLAGIESIVDLSMTTNGTLLSRHARGLARAGLQRVNVSLDAVDADRYAAITGGGDVWPVLAGINAARAAGLSPIRLNCVVEDGSWERDAEHVAQYAATQGLEVRFIRRMDLSRGTFFTVDGGRGGDCPRCNRLRLSSDGYVRPCLFSNLSFSVRELGAVEALSRAVIFKPPAGSVCTDRAMHAIGG